MDNRDYEQLELPRSLAADAMRWMRPNDEVDVLFVDGRPADVQLPSAVEMRVTSTEPGVRGDTASGGGNKPATLESGITVQVPLFVEEGDTIRVDTRSGEYVSRA
jgi:elongation factor P